jgi:uncharacterized protein
VGRPAGWCDGAVAMAGRSYFGATQWMAAARPAPALRAMAPQITGASYYEGWAYQGGAFQLGFMLHWAHGLALADVAVKLQSGSAGPEAFGELVASIDGIDELYRRLPLTDQPALRDVAPYYFDWLEHPSYDDFWRATAPCERYEQVVVPTLNIGGWYDCFLGGTLANYAGVRERGGSEAARRPRLIVGPWAHTTDAGEFAETSFGLMSSAMAADVVGQQVRFFDRHVTAPGGSRDAGPPVRIFVMGADVWRDEEDWPLPHTRFTAYYLHSGGHANTADGDGVLATQPPEDEPADGYRYDPRDPVPTVGGQTLMPGFWVSANAGPRDQREVERRRDVLCYSSAPLEQDTEVTGPIALILHGAARARADLRAAHRSVATANVFKAGHRIRLEVSSSNFPRFDRNTNTGGAIAHERDGDMVPADNRIFHDAARPSHLVLPLIVR